MQHSILLENGRIAQRAIRASLTLYSYPKMNTTKVGDTLCFVCGSLLALLVPTLAAAQSSVTLYGTIDDGFGYTNNSGHGKTYAMQASYDYANEWGLKGVEDLGAGLKAIFTLENGFDLNNGTLGQPERIFGRQAFVGLTSNTAGTITLGRQYDSVVDYVGPLTTNGGYAGFIFTHPFDNDNTNNTFRAQNSVKYASPYFGPVRFGGLYAFSNQPGGFASNRLYSAGASYNSGPLTIAGAYLQSNSGGANASGALSADDTNFIADRQQIWALAATYKVGAATAGLNYSHTALKNPVSSVFFGPLEAASFLKFDNFEAFGRYQFTPAFSALAMYEFTEGSLSNATGTVRPKWNQFGLMATYSLSKRTNVYAQGVYQHVRQGDGSIFENADILGSGGQSSSTSQLVLRVGLQLAF